MYKYAQIQAKRRKDIQKSMQIQADTRKYAQIRANTRKYDQVNAHTCKYAQIHAHTSKYTQILFFYHVTSVARERAQRAQRAKRRKDTTSSHEQLQRAPFSSVRRHVPASLFMKNVLPVHSSDSFTKRYFFATICCIDFWTAFGHELKFMFALVFP